MIGNMAHIFRHQFFFCFYHQIKSSFPVSYRTVSKNSFKGPAERL